jgi:hypothetical protein
VSWIRSSHLLLVNRLLRQLLDLHLEWVDEIENELEPRAGRSA